MRALSERLGAPVRVGWDLDKALPRSVLAVLIVLLLASGVVAAVRHSEPSPTRVVALDSAFTPAPQPPTIPEVRASAREPFLPPGVGVHKVERAVGTATALRPAPQAVTSINPPAPGSYPYRDGRSEAATPDEPSGWIVVGVPRQLGAEIHQTQTDPGSPFGSPVAEYIWGADGVFLGAVGDGSTDAGATCDFEPDRLLYPLPLDVGREWAFESSCTYTEAGAPLTERIEGSSRVARAERVVIGDGDLEVFVVETETEVTNASNPAERIEITRTDYFAAPIGLTVRSETSLRYLRGEELVGEESEGYEFLSVSPR